MLTPKQVSARVKPVDRWLDPLWFKALSDPTRIQLLSCLAKCSRPCSVGEIAECCAVDLSVVSRHLQMLERAGLVESSKQGRTVSYVVKYQEMCSRLRALADALEQCCPTPSRRSDPGECCGPR